MNAPGSRESPDEEAAMSMLYIVKALVQQDSAGLITSYVIAPDTNAVSFERAVTLLMQMQKPVACSGHRIGERLTLSCTPVRDLEQVRGRAAQVAHDVAMVREVLQSPQNPGRHRDRIELRAGSDRLVLTVDGYERWREDYSLAQDNLMAMHYADKATASRAGLIWTVLRTDGGVQVKVKVR